MSNEHKMEQLTLFDMNKKTIEIEDKDVLTDVTNHVKFVHE